MMFVVATLSLCSLDGVPFKILYGVFSIVAAVELMSFLKRGFTRKRLILLIIEMFLLICGVVFVVKVDAAHFWYIILGVPGYDIFAYLSGKLLGGKIIKKSRPFPRISKNKTWEGTVLGIVIATLLVADLMYARDEFATAWMYLFCGPLALCGDLFESFLKRRFKVKDSNEIVIKNKFFSKIEMLVGGSEGHGGFLDRIDSTAFACTILLFVSGLL